MKRRAVIVGVDSYKRVNPLKHALDDAIRMKTFLDSLEGEAAFESAELLKHPNDQDVFHELESACEDLVAGDLFVFYFAGHGVQQSPPGGHHLLLCPEAHPTVLRAGTNGAVSLNVLHEMTQDGEYDCLFVFDACRDELLRGPRGGEKRTMEGSEVFRSLGAGRSRGICVKVWSCADNETAQELGALRGGVFTWAFVEALKQRKRDGESVKVDTDLVQNLVVRGYNKIFTKWNIKITQRPEISLVGGTGIELCPKRTISVTGGAPVLVTRVCDICGKRNIEDNTFRCIGCGKDYLCLKHRPEGTRLCFECHEHEDAANQVRTPGDKTESVIPGTKLSIAFSRCPAGEFMMGSEDGHDDEKPVHKVALNAFNISSTQVTQAQYEAVMKSNPSHFKGPDLPVEKVSWNDAKAFCERLTRLVNDGREFLLPSEAQWEYACRAGSATKYCFGDSEEELKKYAWYNANSDRQTHPVGLKSANDWGLYDMHGNVWEWVEDDWHESYEVDGEKAPEDGSPWLAKARSDRRVLRGGCYYLYTGLCRCAIRFRSGPGFTSSSIGFRLARTP